MDKTMNTGLAVLDGVSVIDPSSIEPGIMTVSSSDSGRDERATMHDFVIAEKKTYTLTWNGIDPDNAAIITALVKNSSKRFIPCVFWDVKQKAFVEGTFYSGDISAPIQQWVTDRANEDGRIMKSLSFKMIEQ